jgi:integrase
MDLSTMTPYLKTRPGRAGFYFQRAVPKELRRVLGKKVWSMKAGPTLAEARRALPVLLEATDAAIRLHSQQLTPEEEILSRFRGAVTDDEMANDLEVDASDLWPRLSEERHQSLNRLMRQPTGSLHTVEELVAVAAQLKQTRPRTQLGWEQSLNELMRISGKNYPTLVDRSDVAAYRSSMLKRGLAATTVKQRLRTLRGLFAVAVGENWIASNPFDQSTLHIRSKARVKEVVSLELADANVGKLSEREQILYWVIRYTGLHISEAAGIRPEDIRDGCLHIVPWDRRPLKNDYRSRVLPIPAKLKEKLSTITGLPTDRELGWFLWSEARGLYETPAGSWGRKLGISPKDLRDNVATVLRGHDVNERVIGAILGHTPKNSTGIYGSVSLEAKAAALSLI